VNRATVPSARLPVLLSTVLCGCLTSASLAAPAPEALDLRYKFDVGETIRLTTTASGKGHTVVSGLLNREEPEQRVPMEVSTELAVTLTPIVVRAEGTVDLAFAIDSMKTSTKVDGVDTTLTWAKTGVAMTVDGEAQEPPAAVQQQRQWVGTPFPMTVSERGELVTGEWPGLDTLDKMLPGMSMRQLLQSSLPQFPDHPVRPGDHWTQAYELKLPPKSGRAGTVTADLEYTLLGSEQFAQRTCAKIALSGLVSAVDLTHPEGDGPTLPPDAKIGLDALSVLLEGVLYFDPEAGRLVDQRLALDLLLGATLAARVGEGDAATTVEAKTRTEMKLTTHTQGATGPAAVAVAAIAPPKSLRG